MDTNRRRQRLGPAAQTQRAMWELAATGKQPGTPSRGTRLRSRACVAVLGAVLLLPTGRASTEYVVSASGDCDGASVGGGLFSAKAGSLGTGFNAVFGLNVMAKGDAASPSPFR